MQRSTLKVRALHCAACCYLCDTMHAHAQGVLNRNPGHCLPAGGAAASDGDSKSEDSQPKQQEQQPPPKEEAKADPAPKVGGQPAQQARPQPGGRQDEVHPCRS